MSHLIPCFILAMTVVIWGQCYLRMGKSLKVIHEAGKWDLLHASLNDNIFPRFLPPPKKKKKTEFKKHMTFS